MRIKNQNCTEHSEEWGSNDERLFPTSQTQQAEEAKGHLYIAKMLNIFLRQTLNNFLMLLFNYFIL